MRYVKAERGRRWARRVLIGGPVVWALALPLAAFEASRPGPPAAVHLLVALPYAMGAVICHQQAARSFALWSQQLPVCARCTGIYAGAALAALVAATLMPHRSHTTREVRILLLIAALPAAATLGYEWVIGTAPSNVVRAISGVPLGAAVALVILAAVDNQVD
jgi:uncharacterized membrane protein